MFRFSCSHRPFCAIRQLDYRAKQKQMNELRGQDQSGNRSAHRHVADRRCEIHSLIFRSLGHLMFVYEQRSLRVWWKYTGMNSWYPTWHSVQWLLRDFIPVFWIAIRVMWNEKICVSADWDTITICKWSCLIFPLSKLNNVINIYFINIV